MIISFPSPNNFLVAIPLKSTWCSLSFSWPTFFFSLFFFHSFFFFQNTQEIVLLYVFYFSSTKFDRLNTQCLGCASWKGNFDGLRVSPTISLFQSFHQILDNILKKYGLLNPLSSLQISSSDFSLQIWLTTSFSHWLFLILFLLLKHLPAFTSLSSHLFIFLFLSHSLCVHI